MFFNKAVLAISGFWLSFQVMASGSISINGKDIKTREDLHSLLAKQLNLPSSYARNMDSLYYMLSTDFTGNNIIKIKHVNSLKAKLGTEYIDGFIQAVMDASEDNPRIIIVLE